MSMPVIDGESVMNVMSSTFATPSSPEAELATVSAGSFMKFLAYLLDELLLFAIDDPGMFFFYLALIMAPFVGIVLYAAWQIRKTAQRVRIEKRSGRAYDTPVSINRTEAIPSVSQSADSQALGDSHSRKEAANRKFHHGVSRRKLGSEKVD